MNIEEQLKKRKVEKDIAINEVKTQIAKLADENKKIMEMVIAYKKGERKIVRTVNQF